jgi:DNA (cytosine-5)-methyltransferase 1
MMRYGSVCSGIEAASVAWHSLGWQPQWFAEIEPFCNALLGQRWPGISNLGDFTTIGDEHGSVELLVGGTPCQSFSVAGLRAGLADDRGNLALEFLRLAARKRVRWLVWENVPGVLSSNGGRDFGAILGGLAVLGYGFAYRVLDAQYFGVPQRRRRVFLVGYFGDWRPAAAVLFERESLLGNPPPRRATGEEVAGTLGSNAQGGFRTTDLDQSGAFIFKSSHYTRGKDGAPSTIAPPLSADADKGDQDPLVFACNAEGSTGLPFLTRSNLGKCVNNQTPLITQPTTFDWQAGGGGSDKSFRGKSRSYVVDKPGCTRALTAAKTLAVFTHPAIAFSIVPDSGQGADLRAAQVDVATSITTEEARKTDRGVRIVARSTVRRLTPRECERLQGFPDDYTLIEYRGKPAADGPRYRALGNSMAVPVMRWIGQRIEAVEAMLAVKRAA